MLFPKFIIEAGKLILSKVATHSNLVTNEVDVRGGGWFRYDDEKQSFIFDGSSYDYGEAKLEDIKSAVENDKVFTNKCCTHSIAKKFKFYYDTKTELIELN